MPRRRPRVRRIPLGFAFSRVLAISAIATVLLVAGLSIQMSLGKDPALGPKLAATGSKSGGSTGGSGSGGGGSGSANQSPLRALVTGAGGESEGEVTDDGGVVIVPSSPSVPSSSVAPTTVAPTPAPAPAPVVTSSS